MPAGRHAAAAEMNMRGKHGSTVLGTDNVMMAAVLAKGTTVIEGAAAEPEVVDLANFLNKMGAKIEGAGTRRIVIEGVKELHGAEHTVIPDRIEAGTFLVAGAIAGERRHAEAASCREHMTGYHRCHRGNAATPSRSVPGTTSPSPAIENPRGVEIRTDPYPGFPTDMQAQFTRAAAPPCPALSVITETIFPQRFMHVAELKRMGPNIRMEGATAIIRGVEQPSGAPVMASDLRASAALVLAGLMAEGTTEVNRLYHIDRGYEHIDDKLGMLGARMERVKVTG